MDKVDRQGIISSMAFKYVDRDILDIIGGPPLLAFRHGENLGQSLMNYTRANKLLSSDVLSHRTDLCPCSLPTMKSLIHPSVGHVITNSVDWIQRPNVKTLFSMDTKFRVDYGEAWFSESIAEYLHIKLKGFANSQHTNFGIPTSAFDRFLDMVSQTLSEKEEEIVSSDDPPIAPLTGRDRAYLSWILNKFVVTCTDKNASRFAFT